MTIPIVISNGVFFNAFANWKITIIYIIFLPILIFLGKSQIPFIYININAYKRVKEVMRSHSKQITYIINVYLCLMRSYSKQIASIISP